MFFFDAIFFSSLCITLKCSWYNFALENMYCIRLEFDCSRISENIGKSSKEENDEVDGSGSELVIIKNPALKAWYSWADDASLRWCYACLFFYHKEMWGSCKNGVL